MSDPRVTPEKRYAQRLHDARMFVHACMERFGYILDVETFERTAQKVCDAFNFLDRHHSS